MYCLIAPTRPVFRWVVGGIPDNDDDDDDDGEADLGVLMMWVVMVGVVEPTWPLSGCWFRAENLATPSLPHCMRGIWGPDD